MTLHPFLKKLDLTIEWWSSPTHQMPNWAINSNVTWKLKRDNYWPLPNGSIFGNQTDEQGRAWELILNRPDVSQAIDAHLQADRLIIGSGSAFFSLKSGHWFNLNLAKWLVIQRSCFTKTKRQIYFWLDYWPCGFWKISLTTSRANKT